MATHAEVVEATKRPRRLRRRLGALVVLIVLAVVLLAGHILSSLRWGTRPTELEHGLDYRIDLNRAKRSELMQLPGVGPKLAERVENYRRAHGPFRKVDDLLNVSGVGPTRLETWRPWLCVDTEEHDAESAPESKASKDSPRGGKGASSASKKI